MQETVKRILEFAVDYAAWSEAKGMDHPYSLDSKLKLEQELIKLLTPLDNEQVKEIMLTTYGIEIKEGDYFDDILLVRAVEKAHGIE